MAAELRKRQILQRAGPCGRKRPRCNLVEAAQACLLASWGHRSPVAVVHTLRELELGHSLHDLEGHTRLLPARLRTGHNHHLWEGHSHHDRDSHPAASPLGLVSAGSHRKAWACHKRQDSD